MPGVLLLVLQIVLHVVYFVCVLGLALYGFQALWLTWHYTRRRPLASPACPAPDQWPSVTIQLPIYNERHVVERLIDACANIDYPPERLQIHVLDDSNDITTAIAERRAAFWREHGLDIQVIRRPERKGFKAGALAHALPLARSDFLAVFDADFEPAADFLTATLPHFLKSGNERVGFIQVRWGHLNRDYSPLTRCQALALDGHFVVEQGGRQAAGFYFGFNGSAGIWRRACLDDPQTGGWQMDTLCEDLDLSYRAQLAGWKPLYLNDVAAPAEIPPQLLAFKRQQFRWAKGSIQTLCKLGGTIWRRRDLPFPARFSAFCHLGNYLIHPLLLMLLLINLPLLLLGADTASPLTYLSLTSFGPPLLYAIAQRRLYPKRWLQHWAYLPLLMLFGTGLSFNNTIAVVQGLTSTGGQFLRTPKFHVRGSADTWRSSAYRLHLQPIILAELTLAFYALASAGVAMCQERWWSLPFLLIYFGGYSVMVAVGVSQALALRPRQRTSNERQPLGFGPGSQP
jgi:cellulose synthase/poly-beta-1,6-N-acetylglucosamine synthase-like glycosyltransferase